MMVLIMGKKASVVQIVSISERSDLLVAISHQMRFTMLKMHSETKMLPVSLVLSRMLVIL